MVAKLLKLRCVKNNTKNLHLINEGKNYIKYLICKLCVTTLVMLDWYSLCSKL